MAPQRPLDFWLKLVDGLINEQFRRMLDEHGISRRQWQLMNLLVGGRATLAELDADIAPFLPGGPDATTADLAELVESGWVAADGQEFDLTDRGRDVHRRLSEVVARHDRELTEGIGAEEYAASVALLERVAHNLGWRDPIAPPDSDTEH